MINSGHKLPPQNPNPEEERKTTHEIEVDGRFFDKDHLKEGVEYRVMDSGSGDKQIAVLYSNAVEGWILENEFDFDLGAIEYGDVLIFRRKK